MLGLSDGWLLAYEFPGLERVESRQIYWEPDEDEDEKSNLSYNRETTEERSDSLSARSGGCGGLARLSLAAPGEESWDLVDPPENANNNTFQDRLDNYARAV